ncbi:MAG TPA: PDZ domain-containing protein [Bacteroidota bacterium]|nr:PDZ domain-containing protein [Bacteroidota bacterium]
MKNRLMIAGLTAVLMIGWNIRLMAQDESEAPLEAKIFNSVASGASHARLGVMIQDVTDRLKEKEKLPVASGAYITEVIDDGPADKAGLVEGDVIVKLGDRDISSADDLTRAVRRLKAGKDVTVGYYHNGEKKDVTVRPDRDRAPQAFSYSFGRQAPMMRMPSMPRTPGMFRITTDEETGGMALEELTRQLAEYFEVPGNRGLLVTEVRHGSDGEKAGVKAGDVVVKVNGTSVHTLEDFREEMSDARNHEAGLELVRKGKPMTVKIKVKEDGDDDDADASVVPGNINGMPGLCSPGVSSAGHDDGFFRQLIGSLGDFGNRIRRDISDAAERVKSLLTS